MNRISSGNIAIGSPNSDARYLNSSQVCAPCIREKRKTVKHSKSDLMNMASGVCDCCEQETETVYMLF